MQFLKVSYFHVPTQEKKQLTTFDHSFERKGSVISFYATGQVEQYTLSSTLARSLSSILYCERLFFLVRPRMSQITVRNFIYYAPRIRKNQCRRHATSRRET